MERYTEYHCGVAVIKDREKLKDAMAVLAAYEDIGLAPEQVQELKERDTAKNPELINGGKPVCPVCGATALACYTFCRDCGQRLMED